MLYSQGTNEFREQSSSPWTQSIHSRAHPVHKQFLSRIYFLLLVLPPSLSCHSSLFRCWMGAYSRLRFAAQVQWLRFLSSFSATCIRSNQPVLTWLARRRNAIGCLSQLLCPSAWSTRAPTGAILQRTYSLETMTGVSKVSEISVTPETNSDQVIINATFIWTTV